MAWVMAHLEMVKSIALGLSEILGLMGLGGISALALKVVGALRAMGAKEPSDNK